MTPKEKANELVNKYLISTPVPFHIEDAKKCALIAVDEILKYSKYILHWMPCNNPECGCKEYWEQVKHEINQL